MLMRAKINFTGTVVGDHPNVLKFLGAVVGDDQSKLKIASVIIVKCRWFPYYPVRRKLKKKYIRSSSVHLKLGHFTCAV